jgi:hypothetical protein
MQMSESARHLMLWLTQQYVAAGFPNHKVWNFSPASNDTVFPELRALGLVQQMGMRGSPFRLTDAGQRWVMANRDERSNDPGETACMYNLIVTGVDGAWDKGNYVLDSSRYLEHTDDDLRSRLKGLDANAIEQLKRLPTLFAYESQVDAPARIGWIADIQQRQNEIRITPRFDAGVAPIAPEVLEARKWELQISDWEMSRTHWAVKTADLFTALQGPQASGPEHPPYVPSSPQPASRSLGDRVFVVHGRHDGSKQEVARFLEQLGIEAVILHERPNAGRTIITKFQEESAGISFAVVLMTPDDLGGLAGEPPQNRARQNVIFELGFFIGKLGASKVCALVSGNIEKPSDFDAVVYIQYGANTGWKTELARELRHAGVRFDPSRVF